MCPSQGGTPEYPEAPVVLPIEESATRGPPTPELQFAGCLPCRAEWV